MPDDNELIKNFETIEEFETHFSQFSAFTNYCENLNKAFNTIKVEGVVYDDDGITKIMNSLNEIIWNNMIVYMKVNYVTRIIKVHQANVDKTKQYVRSL